MVVQIELTEYLGNEPHILLAEDNIACSSECTSGRSLHSDDASETHPRLFLSAQVVVKTRLTTNRHPTPI